jgi:hypothetical protein
MIAPYRQRFPVTEDHRPSTLFATLSHRNLDHGPNTLRQKQSGSYPAVNRIVHPFGPVNKKMPFRA